MKSKNNRLDAIKMIISSKEVGSQEEHRLRSAGRGENGSAVFPEMVSTHYAADGLYESCFQP